MENAASVREKHTARRIGRNSIGESRYHGLLYISPWILGFLLFTLYPFVASFYLSFTKYDLMSAPKWVGMKNYARMFTDPVFLKSVRVLFEYSFIEVPLGRAVRTALNVTIMEHCLATDITVRSGCVTGVTASIPGSGRCWSLAPGM